MLSPLRKRAGKRLREPFGKAGLTVAVIALVFAMLGGAYAATNSGGGKATASKAKAGPRGPRGKTGPAGPAGPQGPAGANGKDGANGSNGSSGANGKDGQSVTGTPIAAGGACGPTNTGVKYTLGATSTNVCNGEDGEEGEPGESPEGIPFDGEHEPTEVNGVPVTEPCHKAGGIEYEVASTGESQVVCNGKEGSPWTAGGTLPSGKEEKGTWAFSVSGGDDQGHALAPISFPIPLVGEVPENAFFYKAAGEGGFEKAGFSEHCEGGSSQPSVKSTEYPGPSKRNTLCVIWDAPALVNATLEEIRSSSFSNPSMSPVGGMLLFSVTGASHGAGGWAVKEK